MIHPRHPALAAALASSLLAAAATADAQPHVDPQARAAARTLGEEGLALFDHGSYAEALDRLERADAMVHAPSLQIFEARCLARLGRLMEAESRYAMVAARVPAAGDSAAFRDAQRDAGKELAALRARLPHLSIVVEGPGAASAQVELDGRPMPAGALGAPQAADPGVHHVRATSGAVVSDRDVTIAEQQTVRVVLLLAPAGAATGPAPAPIVAAAPGPAPDEDRGSGQRTAGWIGLGVGAVGVGVWAVTGGLAVGKKGELDQVCAARVCPPSAQGSVDGYSVLRTISTIGAIAGGVGLAAGAVLVLTAPRARRAPASARLVAWVGAGSGGVRGVFP